MPHIHTEPGQHDHTVSAYIVRIDGDGPRVLLHLHKKHGILMQVGGHIELDETPWQAMAHELVEESGYELSQLSILQPKQSLKSLNTAVLHPIPFSMNTHVINQDHKHMDHAYAFVASESPTKLPKDGESADLRWLTRAELVGLDAAQTIENVRQSYLFILNQIVDNWEPVPAADFEI